MIFLLLIVIRPVLVFPVAFCDTEYVTVSLPLPALFEVIAIQLALLVPLHPQPAAVVITMLPSPPSRVKDLDAAVIEY